MYHMGIDIGGTFTDVVLIGEGGELRTYKAESTPEDLSKGVIQGILLAAEDVGVDVRGLLQNVAYFAHGTTAATNTLIENKGVKTGLITTKGFGDTMLLQRMLGMTAGMAEEDLTHYSKRELADPPLIPASLIKEVTERIDYKGAVVVPLNKEETRRAVRELLEQGVQAVAVCLLWSFRNPAHEKEIKRILLEEAPGVFVTISSELVPVIREYERTATTAINCYLGPAMAALVGNLEKTLKDMGLAGPLRIMNSIGGVLSPEEASDKVVALLSSGPTGGVIGSVYLGQMLGYENIITTDMGGTSFDVGLIVDGRPAIALTTVVYKYHVINPMIKINAIGAGGGSIASVEDGHLKVGPRSAGAIPGPVCYDKGGTEPTVTDADVVLGIIDPGYFLGGRIKLNRAKADAAIKERIADPLGLSVLEAAAGIRTVIDSQMADLLRNVTIEKGYDPRDFVLFAYGGAGPTHCSAYGLELGVRHIVVPVTATVHSAYGAVASDLHHAFEFSDLMITPPFFDVASKYLDVERINSNFSNLEEQGHEALNRSHIKEESMAFHRSMDLRYRRQTHEIVIPAPGGRLSSEDVDELIRSFEKKYEDLYGEGAAFKEAGVEITTFRLDAVGKTPKPQLREYQPNSENPSKALLGERRVHFNELREFSPAKVYRGTDVEAGNLIAGPAIIEYPGTTVVIGPQQVGNIDRFLNILIESK